jgi:hypothetical protein
MIGFEPTDMRVSGEADASSKRFTRRIVVNRGGKVLREIHGLRDIIVSRGLGMRRRLLGLRINIQNVDSSFEDAFPRGLEEKALGGSHNFRWEKMHLGTYQGAACLC